MDMFFRLQFLLLLLLTLLPLSVKGQITKDDIREILILQNVKDPNLEPETKLLYDQLIEKLSYNFNDFLEGAMYSSLSGISLGAQESNLLGYSKNDWLPKPLRDWYDARSMYKADYALFSWQVVFRETDFAADRAAYLKLLRFFKNQWYFAFISNWIIKNTFATIVRDQFRFGKPFYSFQLNLIF